MIAASMHFFHTILYFNCILANKVQSTSLKLPGPTKFALIIRCSNYEFALNIKCKYNGLSRGHNHLSELTGFLKPELSGMHCSSNVDLQIIDKWQRTRRFYCWRNFWKLNNSYYNELTRSRWLQ